MPQKLGCDIKIDIERIAKEYIPMPKDVSIIITEYFYEEYFKITYCTDEWTNHGLKYDLTSIVQLDQDQIEELKNKKDKKNHLILGNCGKTSYDRRLFRVIQTRYPLNFDDIGNINEIVSNINNMIKELENRKKEEERNNRYISRHPSSFLNIIFQ